MRFGEDKKQELISEFIQWCEKIGFGNIQHIEIIEGIPMITKRTIAIQELHFDKTNKGLTKPPMNATME